MSNRHLLHLLTLLTLLGYLFTATSTATDMEAAPPPPPGTKFNVLNRPSGEPNAAVIYAQRCAECHARAFFSPTVEQMSNLTPEEAHKELTWGVMMEFANGLDDFERWELAKFVTSFKTDSERDPRGHGAKMCEDKTPLVADAEHDWPGWSKDNRFHANATNSKVTADSVKNLKLKWAVGFPQVHSFVSGGHKVAVVGDRVYVGSLNHWVYSFDADIRMRALGVRG